jgi:exopolysaccharide production protein ExoY
MGAHMENLTTTKQRDGNLRFATAERSAHSGIFDLDNTREPSDFYHISKRTIDIVLAAFGITLLVPIFLVIALGIILEDGGSIIYRREMIGLRGRRFTMFKFRTMVFDAEIYLERHPELYQIFKENMKLQHDPRVTQFGRFLRRLYLDELPQLFNVLAGEMSLVGPRAIHQNELELYGEYADKRHSVKPGITGLWQISSNRHTCYDERIPLDMRYIDNRSLIFDITILLRTLKVLFLRKGS